VLQDFAADGVVYLELRTTPRAMPAAGLTEADYVRTILEAIAEYEQQASQEGGTGGHSEAGLRTKLILSVTSIPPLPHPFPASSPTCLHTYEKRVCPLISFNLTEHIQIDRRHTPTQATQVLALAKHFLGHGVVGIDLCGDPATPLNLAALSPIFEEEARRRSRDVPHRLGVTLHFAEAECSASDAELDTMLLGWRPDRLGHVICVSERVKREIVGSGRGIGLELCLSCNVHAGMVCGGFEGQ